MTSITSLSRLLYQAQRQIVQQVSYCLIPKGLTMQQLMTLEVIKDNPKAGLVELGQKINVDRTTFSKNLKLIIEHDWIKQLPGPDTRSKRFELTPMGQLKLQLGLEVLQKAEGQLIREVGDELYIQLSILLENFLNRK